MADYGLYYDSTCVDNQENSDNWQGIGELARRLVENAGGAK